jgi:hypothetical protein
MNGRTGTGNGGALPTIPPGILTVPSGAFFTNPWLGTERAGTTGGVYTCYTSNNLTEAGTGFIFPATPPGTLTVPSALFFTNSGYRASWSNRQDVYELYFELGLGKP